MPEPDASKDFWDLVIDRIKRDSAFRAALRQELGGEALKNLAVPHSKVAAWLDAWGPPKPELLQAAGALTPGEWRAVLDAISYTLSSSAVGGTALIAAASKLFFLGNTAD